MRDEDVVNGLWIGSELSLLEQLCLVSFLKHGHVFRLWTYGELTTPVPRAVIVADASAILDRARVFRYRQGANAGSVAGFSDIFRAKLLHDVGGWYTDLDVTCLRRLDVAAPYVFRSHHLKPVVGNIMKAPQGSAVMRRVFELTSERVTPDNTDWELPLAILSECVQEFDLTGYVLPDLCNPDTLDQVLPRVYARAEFDPAWRVFHWCNEYLRGLGVPKDRPPYGSRLRDTYVAHALVPRAPTRSVTRAALAYRREQRVSQARLAEVPRSRRAPGEPVPRAAADPSMKETAFEGGGGLDAAASRGARARRITLHPPEVGERTVAFSFEVDPPASLYESTRFVLTFPAFIEIKGMPERLWWTVFLLCLHSQWPHLAPCQVRLPVRLGAGEVEFWRRLVASYVDTLEGYRTGDTPGRGIEILDGGPSLAPFAPLPDSGWCVTAFSGGKDSLVQVGLLTELTERPVLVTTTSPRADIAEQSTARRRHVLAEIVRRRQVMLVEVTSNFRASWDNQYPFRVGYPVSVNETTDTFLYLSAMLVVGMALGATRLFLASETEVQENVMWNGRIVQHPHFMYSAATQRALSAWLAPAGVMYGSLTWPLHSAQVLELLWTRYRDLADLEYSCFNVGLNEAACSRCAQCFRIALGILAAGGRPERIGIDLPTVLEANAAWEPKDGRPPNPSPKDEVRAHLEAAIIRGVQATPPAQILANVVLGGARRVAERRTWAMLGAYRRLRRRVGGVAAPPARYRVGFLRLVDGLVRDRLATIYGKHFPPAPEASYAGLVARSEALTRWIVEPLTRGSGAALS